MRLGYLGGGAAAARQPRTPSKRRPPWTSTTDLAVRLSLVSAGVWWAGFASFAFAATPRTAAGTPVEGRRIVRQAGLDQLTRSFQDLAAAAAHAALSTVVHVLQRRHPDGHLDDVAVSVAGTVRRPRPARRSVVPRRPHPDDSVRGVLRSGSVRTHRQIRSAPSEPSCSRSSSGAASIVYAYGWLQTTAQAWVHRARSSPSSSADRRRCRGRFFRR